MNSTQILLLSVLGLAVSFLWFVAFWAAVGWGVSIAVRVYRIGMRGADQARELAELERLDRLGA